MATNKPPTQFPSPPTGLQNAEKPVRDVHGIKWLIAVVTILTSTFFFAIDNTIVADIQPAILNTFGNVEKLPWLGTAFALGGISILPWGKAYGVFNIKWLFIASTVLFQAGSALCGAAPSMDSLIFGRALAGFGGAGMYNGGLLYLALTTTPTERSVYMSTAVLSWGVGTVLGPVVGGAFAVSRLTWRWAFYINLLIGVVFAPAYFLTLPNIDLQRDTRTTEKMRQMDWIGMVVFFGGMIAFTMALSFGGTVYSWSSPPEIILWVAAGLLLIATAAVTIYHPLVPKDSRLYPAHFVRRPILVNLQLQTFLLCGINLGTAYYIPLFFQFTAGDDPIGAAVRLLPYICLLVVASLFSGGLLPRIRTFAPFYLGGSILIIAGSATL
ncbi:major facilitator superfamily domain-containing protein, partial [Lineolata rhizophorae]